MPSDRSEAGIRLLGYAAARRRNLVADDAQRPRLVAPRPAGLLPRTLPAVTNGRRVLPLQRGDFRPAHTPSRIPENRPLVSELAGTAMAREAFDSSRTDEAPADDQDLAPVLLDLGSAPESRAVGRVSSGRHRNGRKAVSGRTVSIALGVATLIAAGTGLTAWAMSTPGEVRVDQQLPVTASMTSAPEPAVRSGDSASVPVSPIQPAATTIQIPADPGPGVGTATVPTPGAPAVVSTLGPDDPGFGWPSSAFGTGTP